MASSIGSFNSGTPGTQPLTPGPIKNSDPSEESTAQIEKIRATINLLPIDRRRAEIKLKMELNDRIIAFLESGSTYTEIPEYKATHLCVSETPSCKFSNDYPCNIEFEGKRYLSVTDCFFAQQGISQPQMNEVMMRILRAKFEQNPKLKEELLASKDAYLVCRSYDPHWGDGFDGSKQNEMGTSLMRLRKEFGGTGVVLHSETYINMVLDWKERCHSLTNNLDQVIIHQIFQQCLFGNGKGILALAFTNQHFFKQITSFVRETDLMQLCPKLTFLNARKFQDCTTSISPYAESAGYHWINDEPYIRKILLFSCYSDMESLVEDDEGLTLITVPKGRDFGQINYAIMTGKTTCRFSSRLDGYAKYRHVGYQATCHTALMMFTNNVLKGSRNKNKQEHCELLREARCEMPSLSNYAEVCMAQKILNNKDIYVKGTYGRSNTPPEKGNGNLTAVGNFDLNTLTIDLAPNDERSESLGVGGKRIFRSKHCIHPSPHATDPDDHTPDPDVPPPSGHCTIS